MTDDTTSITTVGDDDIGSWEDRHRDRPCLGPVASTIFPLRFKPLRLRPCSRPEPLTG